MNDEQNPYMDIMHMPHHKAENRPHMSMHNRAAQFSPYAALSGFDGMIAETGRLTNRRIELSENEKERLNRKLVLVNEAIQDKAHPEITVIYFVPDFQKDGGAYETYAGKVRNIDPVIREVVFFAANGRSGGERIPIDDIWEVHGALVDDMDEM